MVNSRVSKVIDNGRPGMQGILETLECRAVIVPVRVLITLLPKIANGEMNLPGLLSLSQGNKDVCGVATKNVARKGEQKLLKGNRLVVSSDAPTATHLYQP